MSYRSNRFDERIIQILQNGGVGFMPSDTIYGLSCRALNEQTVERIYRLKKRDPNKPMIILIAAISQLAQLDINMNQASPAMKYWPGPLTLICEAPSAPLWLQRGIKSLAVRLPDDQKLRELAFKAGPLVSTSANIQDEEPIHSAQEAENIFGNQLDFYVDVGDLSGHQPSTLVRAVNGKLEVIRPGTVKINKEDQQ